MRIKIITLSIIVFGIGISISNAQIAKKEKIEEKLKKIKVDTLLGWKYGGIGNLNLTQVGLSNWAAGGKNSVSINTAVGLFANFKKKKYYWQNSLNISLGGISEENKSIRKTDDKIDFTSQFGRKIKEELFFTTMLNFKSQFIEGINVDNIKISDFMAPGYLLASVGIDYQFKESKLSIFASPLTSKTTFVLDNQLSAKGAYGVDTNKEVRYEVGSYLKILYATELMKNVDLRFKAEFFSNYLHNPGNIDIISELLLNFKVNEYISANISMNAIYDDDIKIEFDENGDGITDRKGPRLQFKEVIGLGLSYKF